MQVAIRSFLGDENIAATMKAPVAKELKNAIYGSAQTPEFKGERWTVEHLCAAGQVRAPLRQTWLSGASHVLSNQVELVVWVVVTIFRGIRGGDYQAPLNLAKKAVVELAANYVSSWIGFIGMCSPLYGQKAYWWAFREFVIQEGAAVKAYANKPVDCEERVREGIKNVLLKESNQDFVDGVAKLITEDEDHSRRTTLLMIELFDKKFPPAPNSIAWSRIVVLATDFKEEGERILIRITKTFNTFTAQFS